MLEGREGRHQATLTITVLDQTRVVGGVETRVVEERETRDGSLAEVSPKVARALEALVQEVNQERRRILGTGPVLHFMVRS